MTMTKYQCHDADRPPTVRVRSFGAVAQGFTPAVAGLAGGRARPRTLAVPQRGRALGGLALVRQPMSWTHRSQLPLGTRSHAVHAHLVGHQRSQHVMIKML